MKYLLVIYLLITYSALAVAAPTSVPSADGWSDFSVPGKEPVSPDSIDKSQIENHPLNQLHEVKPVTLSNETKGNTTLDTPLTAIIPNNLDLKAKNSRIRELRNRKVYDYHENPPAPFFQKSKLDKKNKHLPKVFYQGDFTNLLFSAVNKGDLGAISSLLERGADINGRLKESGITPLMLAVKNSFGNLAQYLVIRGANLNILDNSGNTALHIAATKHDYPTINFLVDNAASINIIDKSGKKPLDYLPENKRTSIIINRLATQAEFDQALFDFTESNSYVGASLAINKGANVNSVNQHGNTALLLAVKANNADIVALLLSHGANPTKCDKDGKLAMDYAIKQNNLLLAPIIDTYAIKYELDHKVRHEAGRAAL